MEKKDNFLEDSYLTPPGNPIPEEWKHENFEFTSGIDTVWLYNDIREIEKKFLQYNLHIEDF